MEEKLQAAFVKGLGLMPPVDFRTLAFAISQGWDSIAHMKLIAAIEEEFAIMLDTDDVLALSSFPVALDIVKKYVPVS